MKTLQERYEDAFTALGWVRDYSARTQKYVVLMPGPQGGKGIGDILVYQPTDKMRLYLGRNGSLRSGRRGATLSVAVGDNWRQKILTQHEAKQVEASHNILIGLMTQLENR